MTKIWSKLPEQLRKRIASYIWRAAGLGAVAVLNALSEGLVGFEIPTWAVAAVGLGVGELTKWIMGRVNA